MKSLAILTAALCLTFICECSSEARNDIGGGSGDTLHLKQTHYFLGDLDIQASKTGVRIQSLGSWKFVLVSHAPDWKVTVFRNDDKSYFEEPLKAFAETGLVSQMLVGKKPMTAKEKPKPTEMKIGGERVQRVLNQFCLGEFVDGKNLVAPQVQAILYSSIRMPTYGGIALRWVQKKEGRDWMTGMKDDQMHVFLSTTSATMERAPANLYSAPTGYKLGKSMSETLLSKESRASSADAKDLFDIAK